MTDEQQRAGRNLIVLATLADVTQRLAADDVRSMPIKGGALLASQVVQPHQRHLDDLDVWVAAHDARRAYDTLVAAGYRADASVTHKGERSVDVPTHQLPILRAPFGTIVELHKGSHAAGDAGEFEACFVCGADVVVYGVSVRVPSLLHQLEQLCGHVVVHHALELRYWPRHVDDVRALLAREPSLALLRARSDEVGLSLRVAHGVDDPRSADALLTRLFLAPNKPTAATARALALVTRAVRFVTSDPLGFLRVIAPSEAHLRFTGDLDDTSTPRAHLRRWTRILRRV